MGALDGVSLHLVESVDDAAAFMRWLGERREILAVDTETTGLDHRRDTVRLVQFGDATTGWAIPWERWNGVSLEALEKYDGETAYHNTKFDVLFLERCGKTSLPWGKMHNTRTLAHIVNPTKSTALKTLCTKYVDSRAAGLQAQLDEAMVTAGWTWATVPVSFQPYWSYGALDAVMTAQLFDVLSHRVINTSYHHVYEVEMACERILANMEVKGAAVDVPFAEQKRTEMLAYIQQARAWTTEHHGVSPSANQQVVRRMLELGVILSKTTKGGAFSLDEEVLQEIQITHPGMPGDLARVVLGARKLTKLVSTYLDHFIEENIDGRVHGSINALGAKTGRMSIQKPPLQTLPRADEGNLAAIAVRDCFIPKEGHKLVMADFDQIELRLMAHFSQDPTMLEVLAGTGDPFTEFARRIYNDPELQKKDPRRQLTKNASYAKAYGAGPEKFSLTAGVPISQGRAFLEMFDHQFPGVRRFQSEVQRVAEGRWSQEGTAYVHTPLGRKLQCEDDKFYKLVNYLIQGTAADVLKQKLVELDLAGFGEFLVLPVHDEVILEVPDDVVADVVHDIGAIMEDTTSFKVSLPVGVDGPYERWGDKYK